mgnify:CR=1 FL=1
MLGMGGRMKVDCQVRESASPWLYASMAICCHAASVCLPTHLPACLPAGYRLDADSPASLRPSHDRRAQQRVAKTAGATKQKLVRVCVCSSVV